MIETVGTLLGYEFVRNAVVTGLLASVLCGVVGTFVVVKRLVFIGGGISHAAFGGLGICYFFGVEPLLGAAAVAVLSAVLLGAEPPRRGRSHDAMIGILWAAGMAVGIVFIARTPGYAPNLMTYLFGNILSVGRSDVVLVSVFTLLVLGLLALFFKELVAVAFDEEFAAVQGVPVRRMRLLLLVLIALSVVLLLRLVGIILVMALLTVPPVIGLRLGRGFLGVMMVSTLIGTLVTLGGLAVSYLYDLPSGPAIVLLGVALMVAVEIAVRWRARRAATQPAGSVP